MNLFMQKKTHYHHGYARSYAIKGFTLMEFLVASALSIIVLMAIGTTYFITRHMKDASDSRLIVQQDLRNAGELIIRDSRMAGSFGCFSMGNTLSRDFIAQVIAGGATRNPNRFQASNGIALALYDNSGNDVSDASGLQVVNSTDANYNTLSQAIGAQGFTSDGASPFLLFTYGLDPEQITFLPGNANQFRIDSGSVTAQWARQGGAVALSSCNRMMVMSQPNIQQDGTISNSNVAINQALNDKTVFYAPQTTLSRVYSVLYAVGRVDNVDTDNGLYRFTLNSTGGWDGPQLMVAHLDNLTVNEIYASCTNSSNSSFSQNRASLVNPAVLDQRVSRLPALLEVQLNVRADAAANSYGTVNQYLIRANVRGGNVCADPA